jgi:hypothetical protein
MSYREERSAGDSANYLIPCGIIGPDRKIPAVVLGQGFSLVQTTGRTDVIRSQKNEGTVTDIRPIQNEDNHASALAEIVRYFVSEPDPGTSEGDRFDQLALVIKEYERKRWPIEPADAPSIVAN